MATIEEVRAVKVLLEKKILKMILEFEVTYGLSVIDIHHRDVVVETIGEQNKYITSYVALEIVI